MVGNITKIILATVMLVLGGLIVVSTYNNNQPLTTSSRADETDNWNKCNADFSNAPCGICTVSNMTNGDLSFSCRLVCSGAGETCPGGVGTQSITGKWITCSEIGDQTCDSSKTDFKQEGIIGSSPWTLTRGETGEYTGTFPAIQCGRASVELLMDAPGVDVAGAIYDTQVSCTLPTSTPTGTLTPSPTATETPIATETLTPTETPTPSPTGEITPTIILSQTVTPTPTKTPTLTPTLTVTPSSVLTQTPPPNLPQSGIPAPIFFIAVPLMLLLLGLAL